MSDDDAPGWDAIDAAFAAVYGAQQPLHWGMTPWMGGRALTGLSAFRSERGRPHWHFVSYGLSELYDKESDVAEVSGYGIELTFRVPRVGDTPPHWAINLVQNIADYVGRSGNVVRPGQYMDPKGKIATDEETDLRALFFAADPEIAARDTPNGKVTFVQLVGATFDEFEAAQRWRTDGVLAMLAGADPLLITDLARRSLLHDPDRRRDVEQGLLKEGSTCGRLYVARAGMEFEGGRTVLALGAVALKSLNFILPYRLGFGRSLQLHDGKGGVTFAPGEADAVDPARDRVTLTPASVRAWIDIIETKAGDYALPGLPGVVIRIEPSVITDPEGREIGRVG